MWHGAWGGEGHVGTRWRLRHRAAFNGSEGWFWLHGGLSDLLIIFVCFLLSFACDGCLVLCFSRPWVIYFGGVLVGCVKRRGGRYVCVSDLGESLVFVIVFLVCSAGAVVVRV